MLLKVEESKFTGKDLDEETGLYYFNARWYDAELGRFISEDPIGFGINWYAYSNNNPLLYIDPSGLVYVKHPDGGGSIQSTYDPSKIRQREAQEGIKPPVTSKPPSMPDSKTDVDIESDSVDKRDSDDSSSGDLPPLYISPAKLLRDLNKRYNKWHTEDYGLPEMERKDIAALIPEIPYSGDMITDALKEIPNALIDLINIIPRLGNQIATEASYAYEHGNDYLRWNQENIVNIFNGVVISTEQAGDYLSSTPIDQILSDTGKIAYETLCSHDFRRAILQTGMIAVIGFKYQQWKASKYSTGAYKVKNKLRTPKQTTVIGSRKDTLNYLGKKGYNVLDIKDWSAKKNIKWLDSAYRRGDTIMFLTDPNKHSLLMQQLGKTSQFLNIEIPYLRYKEALGSVINKF